MYAHGEGGAGIGPFAAVPDGGIAGGAVCIPGGQREAEEGREKDAVGIAVALQDFPHGGAVQGQVHRHFFVGRRLRPEDVREDSAFRLGGRPELLRKPLFGFLEGFAFPLLLLVQGYPGAADFLQGNFLAVVGCAQVIQDNGDAGSVGNDMVEVHIEIGALGCLVDFQAEETVFQQVHGLGEAFPCLFDVFDFPDIGLPDLLGLYHTGRPVFGADVGEDVGVGGHQ